MRNERVEMERARLMARMDREDTAPLIEAWRERRSQTGYERWMRVHGRMLGWALLWLYVGGVAALVWTWLT